MRKCSEANGLNIDVNLLKPTHEQSFWVNTLGADISRRTGFSAKEFS